MIRLFSILVCAILLSQNILAQTPQFRLWGSTSTHDQILNEKRGYGSVFSVNADGSDLQTVKEFASNPDGSIPFGGLTKLANGNLVGMTVQGGADDSGVIYTLNADGSGYAKIFTFNAGSGYAPRGKLIQASNGDLYGMTSDSDPGSGTIFRVKTDGSDFVKLYEFTDQANGAYPRGGLIECSDGKLYGMTSGGGSNHWGVAFKINLDGTGFQKILNFDGQLDNAPWGELVEGADGFLFGMSSGKGVFKFRKDGSDFERIYTLGQDSYGIGSLIKLSNGDLLGTASGGANSGSFLFSIKPDGTDFTVLYDFNVLVKGNITLSPSGQIFGVADDFNSGMIFRIETNGTGFTVLYSAGGLENGVEQRNVIESIPGTLIGVASKGGASNNGIVFKLSSGVLTRLKEFPQEGADPESSLIKGSDGDLYGCTTSGGAYGWGTIFKIKVDGSGYAKIFDFDGMNGRNPMGKLVEIPGGFLCGTTKKGGSALAGNIFKVRLDGTDFVSLKEFPYIHLNPSGDLILGTDGYLYGATLNQMSNHPEKGYVFRMLPNGTDFSIVLDFASHAATLGINPVGIKQLSNGDLIGVTISGGANFGGTIFKVKPDGSNLVKLRDLDFSYFNVASYNVPFEATNGKLYGTNFLNYYVYSINADGTNYTQYNSPNGYQSYGNFIELPGGSMYATTLGSIYKFDLSTSSFTNLFPQVFNPAFSKAYIYSGLLAVEKQSQTITFNPIGLPKYFGDQSFQLNATSSSGLPVSFTSSNTSVATIAGNTVAIVGGGTTTISALQAGDITRGSAHVEQTLVIGKADQTIAFNSLAAKALGDAPFALSATASSGLTISFTSSDESIAVISGNTVTMVGEGVVTITAKQGGNSNYNAAADVSQILNVNPDPSDFRIWGTTNGTTTGLPDGFGSIFSIDLNGANVIKEHAFNNTDGSALNAGVMLGSDGFLYGTTRYGGLNDKGTIFKMKTDGTGFVKIFDFDGANGEDSHAGLIEGPNGFLYGATTLGGAYSSGIVFKIKKDGTGFQNLVDLNSATGYSIRASLLVASNDMLYGTTYQGGSNDAGTIFRINPDGTGVLVLKHFGGLDGAYLNGPLIQALDGDLYGTAALGGQSDQGTIFKIKLDGSGFVKLHDFNLTNGGLPLGTLLQASNGQLYGTTSGGGNVSVPGQGIYNYGTIFRINTNGTSFQELYDFNLPDDGRVPDSGLIQFETGSLYGITLLGGDNDKGTIFKINLDGTDYSKIYDFETTIGSSPRYKLTLVKKLNQSITFDQPPVLTMGDNPYSVGGSSSSGLPLTYTISDANTATISGNTVTMVGEGTTTITAKQNGNQYYLRAADVAKTLTITRKNQAITFSQLPDKTLGDNPFNLTAVSSSNLVISYASSNTSVATVSGATITMIGLGDVTITASQDGSPIYFPAVPVARTFRMKGSQIITFDPLSEKTFGADPFNLMATSSSSLLVAFESSNSNVATVSGSTVTIVGAGTTMITAKQVGNSSFSSAPDIVQTLTVKKANQTVTLNSIAAKTFGDAAFALSATTTSGLPISYMSSDETVATISGSTVTIVGAGFANITAKQSGNANYNAATEVVQTLTVNKASQAITFPTISSKTFGDVPFNLAGTSNSGLAVQYSSASDRITLTGSQVTLLKSGSVTVNADQPGDGNYITATAISQTFCINPSKPIITTTGLNSGTPVLTSSSSTGNQWYKNGVLLNDAVSNTLSPKSDGSYTVKVTIDNCSSELSAEQILVITGDITSSSVSSFLLFPNPVKDNLSINLTVFDGNSQVEIVIYDASGKVMDKVLGQGEKATVSVRSYSAGSYFLKASQRNQTHVAKFAKE